MEYGDPGELFTGLVAWAEGYVDLDSPLLKLAVLVTMTGWLFEKTPALPILNPRGASETGKTRLATILWQISFRGMRGDGALSHSSLFRTAEKWAGTLLVNEADLPRYQREGSESGALAKFYNARYEQGTYIWRTNKETLKVEGFRVFGPTILVTRKGFGDDAVESRCLVLPMKTTGREDIPLNLPPEFYTEAQEWRNKLLLFRLRHYFRFENDYGLRFEGLQPRIQQILQPVASLARDVSPGLFAQVKELAKELNERVIEDRSESTDGMILRTWLQMKREDSGARPQASEIQKRLEDAGRKFSPKYIGQRARALGFKSKKSGSLRYLDIDGEDLRLLIPKYVPQDERVDLQAGALLQSTIGTVGTVGTDVGDRVPERKRLVDYAQPLIEEEIHEVLQVDPRIVPPFLTQRVQGNLRGGKVSGGPVPPIAFEEIHRIVLEAAEER